MSSNTPFPSSDLEVFKENTLILEHFVNSTEDTHPDRLGRVRPTITGIIKESFNIRTDIGNMNESIIGMSRWDDVPKNTSLTLGGDNGALNKQAQALFNRTMLLKTLSREALRRTYQEVGLNLVEGSFEEGAVITSTTDVVLHEKTGKCYSGPIGNVPKGTNPISGSFVDKSNISRTVAVSNYSSLADAINKNKLIKNLNIIIDKDTKETTSVYYSGDIEISGKGVVELQTGVTVFLNHSNGSLKSGRWVEYTTVDTGVNYNIFAISSTTFTEVSVSSSLNRVGLKARNSISNVFGKVTYNGIITGDFTPIPTGINDAVIFVESVNELNVDGMENKSIGAERIIKCSHSVNTFSIQHAKMRGSTKRQVIDTYIDTRKVICKHNDVKMVFETFIEGKLKTEVDIPGVAPAQVAVDISQNVFNIGMDSCLRVALFQGPGGTSLEPIGYDSLFVASDNVINGRPTSSAFDVRGFTLFKELGTIYKNTSLPGRNAVNVIACDTITIKDITGDSYAINISGEGSSQGGVLYNRSPKKIDLSKVCPNDYNNVGFIFIDKSSGIKKLTIDGCYANESASSPASTGFVYIKDSAIDKVRIKDNDILFNTSIPLRTSGTVTIGRKLIENNAWQLDFIPFTTQSISTGTSIRFPMPNINGNYTGGTERFESWFTEDLKGCTITAYKEGGVIYVEIYNYTGTTQTLDTGVIYVSTTVLS